MLLAGPVRVLVSVVAGLAYATATVQHEGFGVGVSKGLVYGITVYIALAVVAAIRWVWRNRGEWAECIAEPDGEPGRSDFPRLGR